jgi:hypothetical protein
VNGERLVISCPWVVAMALALSLHLRRVELPFCYRLMLRSLELMAVEARIGGERRLKRFGCGRQRQSHHSAATLHTRASLSPGDGYTCTTSEHITLCMRGPPRARSLNIHRAASAP